MKPREGGPERTLVLGGERIETQESRERNGEVGEMFRVLESNRARETEEG